MAFAQMLHLKLGWPGCFPFEGLQTNLVNVSESSGIGWFCFTFAPKICIIWGGSYWRVISIFVDVSECAGAGGFGTDTSHKNRIRWVFSVWIARDTLCKCSSMHNDWALFFWYSVKIMVTRVFSCSWAADKILSLFEWSETGGFVQTLDLNLG